MATRDTTDGREDETDISSQGGGARVGDYLISDVSAHVQSRPVIQSRRAESCGDDDDAMHPLLYTSGVSVSVCMHTHNEKSTRVSRAPLDAYDFPFFQGILTYLFLNIVLVAVVDYPEHTIS